MMCWLAATSSVFLLLSGATVNQLTMAASQQNSPVVQPTQARPMGGVQLDLEPRRAQVFVDGTYAGLVNDFAGYYRHLQLSAGHHRLEIFTPGYVPLIFDVTVVPERTITYRQSLLEVSRGW